MKDAHTYGGYWHYLSQDVLFGVDSSATNEPQQVLQFFGDRVLSNVYGL